MAQYGQQQQQYGQQYEQPAAVPDQPYEYMDEASGQVMVYDPRNGMSYTTEYYQQMQQQQQQPQQQQYQQQQYAQTPQQTQYPSFQQPQQQWGEPAQNQFPQQSQQQPQQQQQTPKPQARIDPKSIPRPLYNYSETVKFFTRAGTAPPGANTNYVAIDEGNASPRFMRLTCNHIPSTPELSDMSRIAIGAIIQPFANLGREEEPVPVVDFGPAGPLRCSRCKAYVNPFFKFVEGGRTFVCNLCDQKNEVPREYQCNLDSNGMRRDKSERPELCHGSVDIIVTGDYVTRPIQDPCYFFMIDVSYSSAVTGLLHVAVQSIRNCLDAIAYNPRARVGVMTYDSRLHFYRINPMQRSPKLLYVADVETPFVPATVDDLLIYPCNPEGRALFEAALEMIPSTFGANRNEANAFGAACAAASELLQTSGGKVTVFQSNLPSVGAGALKNRDESSVYNTDKEKFLYVPASPFYEKLATTSSERAVSFDLFVCSNSYVDIATIGLLASNTCGQVNYYHGFHARKDGESLQNDFYHNLTRFTAFDAVMTCRVTNGLKVSEYFGNAQRRYPQELECAMVDCDKTFAIRLTHENALPKDLQEASIQCALLYTTAEGQRRIRLHTMSVPVSTQLGVVFRNADVDAVIAMSLKQTVLRIPMCTHAQVRGELVTACIDILHVYRKKCAATTSSGQLILPESLKVLPLFTLSLLKSALLCDGTRSDERAYLAHMASFISAAATIPFVFPHMYSLHDMEDHIGVVFEDGSVHLPSLHPLLTSEVSGLSSDGATTNYDSMYVLDNGKTLTVYIGDAVDPSLVNELFEDSQNEPNKLALRPFVPTDPGCLASRVNLLLDTLRRDRPTFAPLIVLRRGFGAVQTPTGYGQSRANIADETAPFLSHMFEDGIGDKDKEAATATADKLSYVAFLCYVHRKIQDRFS